MKHVDLKAIDSYYTEKVQQYGNTAKGVDWNSEESQELRFLQLTSHLSNDNKRLLDYGCGVAGLNQYLKQTKAAIEYLGYDISEEMIIRAKNLFPDIFFTTNINDFPNIHHVVASGIFNVKLANSDYEWGIYVRDTLDKFNSIAVDTFAFNMLTSYSDVNKKKEYLYYEDPSVILKYCMDKYTKNVSILQGYGLFEFTVIVKK